MAEKTDDPPRVIDQIAERRDVYVIATALLKQLGCVFYPIDAMALSDWLLGEDVLTDLITSAEDEADTEETNDNEDAEGGN